MNRQQFRAPRGTSDILPENQNAWKIFVESAEEVARKFGYGRIETPMFEDARLFVRGIGEITDVVENETYTFADRGGDLVTLRPEGTAPVCRAYLEHGMHNMAQPIRMYYLGPFFRYERPQAGRFRQLHQFGIEALGDKDAALDAEVIDVAWSLLNELGIGNLSLVINSIGDELCKPRYIDHLRQYYEPNLSSLCGNCRKRLGENPLRLLDCKEDACQPVIDSAPNFVEFLCDSCASHWSSLKGYLTTLGIPFKEDKRLVRGFDYYTRTTFEIEPPGGGRQAVIAGGGRYDGLLAELGGPSIPGIGFGMGIERVLAMLMTNDPVESSTDGPKLMIAAIGEEARMVGVSLSTALRKSKIPALLGPSSRGLRSQLKYASSINATHALIIGDAEIAKDMVIVRNLKQSHQEEIEQARVLSYFKAM